MTINRCYLKNISNMSDKVIIDASCTIQSIFQLSIFLRFGRGLDIDVRQEKLEVAKRDTRHCWDEWSWSQWGNPLQKKIHLLSSFFCSRLWRFPSPLARIHLHSPNRCLFRLRGLPQGQPIDIPANDSCWSWPLIHWTFDCCHCEGLKVLIATKS